MNKQTKNKENTIAVTRGKGWRRVKWVKANTCKVEDGNWIFGGEHAIEEGLPW